MTRYFSNALRPVLLLTIFAMYSPIRPAIADHGGPTSHHDYNLSVPATSSTGNYTVTYQGPGNSQLQEKVGNGSYLTVATPVPPQSVSFSGKTSGTYTYRVFWRFCYYSCQDFYTAPESIVVSVAPPTPPVPTGLSTPATDDDGTYTVSWNTSAGATSYELRRRRNSGAWSTVQNTSAVSKSETLLADGTYDYQVRACSSTCSAYTTTQTTVVDSSSGSTTSAVSYTYDGLGRLSTVTYADGKVIEYTYDSAGNRTTKDTSQGTPP